MRTLPGSLAAGALAATILFGAAGCGDPATTSGTTGGATSAAPAASTQAKPPASATAAAPPASAAPSSSASAATDEPPTQADFEDEAEREIGTDNLTDELAKLEKELDAK